MSAGSQDRNSTVGEAAEQAPGDISLQTTHIQSVAP